MMISAARDIRSTTAYQLAERIGTAARAPGSGSICDAVDLHVSPKGGVAAYSGVVFDRLEGAPQTRLCETNLESGETRFLTLGPNTDRMPRYSPDGTLLAFLSDRQKAGDFQLHLLDLGRLEARPAPSVAGWIEYLQWSPDGTRLLLGVAGHGADIAGGQGAIASKAEEDRLPTWMPRLETGDEAFKWRTLWVYSLADNSVREVATPGANAWEACWCGNDAIAMVASDSPDEGAWYDSDLRILDMASDKIEVLFRPEHQIGWPSASPDGRHVTFVEAVCSDRGLVSGDLSIIERSSGRIDRIDTRSIDVTHVEWRTGARLLLAGHRGLETVVASHSIGSPVEEIWSSAELGTTGRYASVAGLGSASDFAMIAEGFRQAPELAVVKSGTYHRVRSFDIAYHEQIEILAEVRQERWTGPDNLEIEGWLLLPRGTAPFPTIMYVHGGPVWHWRSRWLARANIELLVLLHEGYAIFLPNPRGSSGRGQPFAKAVVGDMGGKDATDCLLGLDSIVDQGLADPERLGLTGVSYGGFMTNWLVTQDHRFAAAVPVAPISNYVTEHFLSNIPRFVSIFLDDTFDNPGGEYFHRSPLMHVKNVQTPVLGICGALDRCTPPEEAAQFHAALVENGCPSVLALYPEEGHGVRHFPAVFDYCARLLGWFDQYLKAGESSRTQARSSSPIQP